MQKWPVGSSASSAVKSAPEWSLRKIQFISEIFGLRSESISAVQSNALLASLNVTDRIKDACHPERINPPFLSDV
jgi:hypothetical protein